MASIGPYQSILVPFISDPVFIGPRNLAGFRNNSQQMCACGGQDQPEFAIFVYCRGNITTGPTHRFPMPDYLPFRSFCSNATTEVFLSARSEQITMLSTIRGLSANSPQMPMGLFTRYSRSIIIVNINTPYHFPVSSIQTTQFTNP